MIHETLAHLEAVSLKEFSEEERGIISSYNESLHEIDERWLRVNRCTQGVRDAIRHYFGPYRRRGPEDLRSLFLAAAAGDNKVTIPEKRTFVRLLRANQNN